MYVCVCTYVFMSCTATCVYLCNMCVLTKGTASLPSSKYFQNVKPMRSSTVAVSIATIHYIHVSNSIQQGVLHVQVTYVVWSLVLVCEDPIMRDALYPFLFLVVSLSLSSSLSLSPSPSLSLSPPSLPPSLPSHSP